MYRSSKESNTFLLSLSKAIIPNIHIKQIPEYTITLPVRVNEINNRTINTNNMSQKTGFVVTLTDIFVCPDIEKYVTTIFAPIPLPK
jgi:hypothetical protein